MSDEDFQAAYQRQEATLRPSQREIIALIEDGIRNRVYGCWVPLLAQGVPDSPEAISQLQRLAWRQVVAPLLERGVLGHVRMQAVNLGRGMEASVQVVLAEGFWRPAT